jgi:peptide/nickel transport system permease protein
MGRYLVRRILQMIPVMLGVSIFVFVGMQIIPGDVATLLLGDKATPEALARLRADLRLDDPIYVRYLRWLQKAVTGDFGISLRTRQRALQEVKWALPMTAELSIISLLISVLVGVPVGVMAAIRQYSLFDTASMLFVLFGVSMPIFWTGLVLLMLFGGTLGWLPIGGILDDGITLRTITGIHLIDALLEGNMAAFTSAARHLVLPAIALGSIPMATVARMTRSTMLEVLRQDYVRTARAKGLAERVVLVRHALRNTLIPVVTIIGLEFGLLLSGAVLTETVFALPGLGRLAITSLLARDYSVVQAVVLVTALIIVVVNLVVDLLYAYLDPRISYT